ncbi:HobA family DNA replication regulator [Nitratifractor sp.]
MQALLDWTLKTIRAERSDFSWMEERRFDWTPLVCSAVGKILEGQTVLILTDEKRRWFGRYILGAVNKVEHRRPFFPFYPMEAIFSNLSQIENTHDIELLEDMLSISFPGGYFLWYIGEGDSRGTKLAYRSEENYLWLLDEQLPGSFTLSSSDPLLDIKLLQLYKLFDRTLEAILFNEVSPD